MGLAVPIKFDVFFLIANRTLCFFLFFQAEDGIRDADVTGVQTCALPIVTPCPKFLNCAKDCEDYVLDTANAGHINNLVQLQVRTQLALDQALQQHAKGTLDVSENWIAEAQATLSGVRRILEAASAQPVAAVRPFSGKGSRFEALEQKRA